MRIVVSLALMGWWGLALTSVVDARPKPMTKADWKAKVRAPSWKTARALAATKARPHVQPYSKLRPLGGLRWAAVFGVRAQRRDDPRLELLVFDKAGGAWHVSRLLLADYSSARFRAAKKIIVEGCDKAVQRVLPSKKHHAGRVLVLAA